MRSRKKSGFTLLELIVVIVVLAVLALIAVPTFQTVKDRANEARVEQTMNAVLRDVQAILAFNDGTTFAQAMVLAVGELPAAGSAGVAAANGYTATTAATTGATVFSYGEATVSSVTYYGVAVMSEGQTHMCRFGGTVIRECWWADADATANTGAAAAAGEGGSAPTTTTTTPTTTTVPQTDFVSVAVAPGVSGSSCIHTHVVNSSPPATTSISWKIRCYFDPASASGYFNGSSLGGAASSPLCGDVGSVLVNGLGLMVDQSGNFNCEAYRVGPDDGLPTGMMEMEGTSFGFTYDVGPLATVLASPAYFSLANTSSSAYVILGTYTGAATDPVSSKPVAAAAYATSYPAYRWGSPA